MKSKLRLESRRLARRGAGGLVKKFAPKFSSLADRYARRARLLCLTCIVSYDILEEVIRSTINMSEQSEPFEVGDLVTVYPASIRDMPAIMQGAVVIKRHHTRGGLYSVYYRGKKWRNIHQNEMVTCR